MSVSGIGSQTMAVNIELPETSELKSAEEITARSAQDLHMQVSLKLLKETMDVEKQMANLILDMLV